MKQLVLQVPLEHALALEEQLALYDLEGLEIINPQDRLYTDPLWEEDEAPPPPKLDEAIIKVFASDDVFESILQHEQRLFSSFRHEEVIEKDWNDLWAKRFPGVETEKIFIRPPWVEGREDKIDLIIDPGMAFGTGSHETTLLCVEVLEDYLKEDDLVIDVGTGSGILAILSKKLGAKKVFARELDEKALENAKINAELNDTQVLFSHGDLLQGFTEKVDLIVGNILPVILVRMVEDAAKLLDEGKILILSGILDKRVAELLECYGGYFELLEQRSQGEWVVLVLRRK